MATKPTTPVISWATATNYNQGPDIGTPTKVSMPQTVDGHYGGSAFAPTAQEENWMRNNQQEWAAYFEYQTDELEVYSPKPLILNYSGQTMAASTAPFTPITSQIVSPLASSGIVVDEALGRVTFNRASVVLVQGVIKIQSISSNVQDEFTATFDELTGGNLSHGMGLHLQAPGQTDGILTFSGGFSVGAGAIVGMRAISPSNGGCSGETISTAQSAGLITMTAVRTT